MDKPRQSLAKVWESKAHVEREQKGTEKRERERESEKCLLVKEATLDKTTGYFKTDK